MKKHSRRPSPQVNTSDDLLVAVLPISSLEGFACGLMPWLLSGKGTAAASLALARSEDPMLISAVCMGIGATSLHLVSSSPLQRSMDYTEACQITVGLDIDAIRETFAQVSPERDASGALGGAAHATEAVANKAEANLFSAKPLTKESAEQNAALTLYLDVKGELHEFTTREYDQAVSELRAAMSDVIDKASLNLLPSSTESSLSSSSSSRIQFIIHGSVGRAASVLPKCCALGDKFVRSLRGRREVELDVEVGMTISYVQKTSSKLSGTIEEESKDEPASGTAGKLVDSGGTGGASWLGWIGLGGSGRGTSESWVPGPEDKETASELLSATVLSVDKINKMYGQGIKLFAGKEVEQAAMVFNETATAAAAVAAEGGVHSEAASNICCKAWGNLGNCKEKLGDIETAVRAWTHCLERLAEPKKRSSVYLNIALALAKIGKVTEAQEQQNHSLHEIDLALDANEITVAAAQKLRSKILSKVRGAMRTVSAAEAGLNVQVLARDTI